MVFQKDGSVTAELAVQFDQYMRQYAGLYEELAEKTKEYMPSFSREPVVIDVGAGPGLFSVVLHERVPAAWLLGVDLSRSMLQLAERNNREAGVFRFIPVQGRAEHLPFRENSVDVVVCRFSLLYWQTPVDGCREIHRVLRPGGRVVIESLNARLSGWRQWMMLRQMGLHGAKRRVILYQKNAYERAFTVSDVEGFLVDAGFSVIQKEGESRDWKFLVVAEK
ncbi:MAG: class I SAM-dependent methyltransferase [Methanobacteriota archaeon]